MLFDLFGPLKMLINPVNCWIIFNNYSYDLNLGFQSKNESYLNHIDSNE